MTKQNPNAFLDVIPIWQAALTTPGLTLRFLTENKAIYYLQRCYRYRAALIAHQEALNPIPGYYGVTPYDHFVIRRTDCSLTFHVKEVPYHIATDAEGNVIDINDRQGGPGVWLVTLVH